MYDSARWFLFREKRYIDSIGMVMKLIFIVVPFVVTGLTLRHLHVNADEFYHVLGSTPVSSWILGLSLLIFYLSWYRGAYFDVGIQKEVYAFPPDLKLRWRDVGVMFTVAVTFTVLGYFLSRPVIFSVILVIFWTINVFAWRYLVSQVVDTAGLNSAHGYRVKQQYLDLAKLDSVLRYMTGSWQWWRFSIGGVIALLTLVFAFFGSRTMTPRGPHLLPPLTCVALLVFLFVIVVEVWIWYKRFVTVLRLACFDELAHEYELTPKTTTAPSGPEFQPPVT